MTDKKIPEMKPLFKERMKELLNEKDFQNYLEILKVQPVKSIRCNKLKISPENLKKRLEGRGWKINQLWRNHPEIMIIEGKIDTKTINEEKKDNLREIDKETQNFQEKIIKEKNSKLNPLQQNTSDFLLTDNFQELEPGELGRSIEHLLGYYYIQELASMLPVIALSPKPGERILDLCSAPGSKTTQICSEMNNTGNIIANEVSLGRLRILASNLERCGVANTIITKKDGIALCRRLKKEEWEFDRILVDAPCSGEGTLRSSYKTYEMWNPKTITSLCRLQKALVAEAISILAPRGILVYSTCTHAPEENEEVVNFILENFPEMEILDADLPVKTRNGIIKWKEKNFRQEVEKSCRVYPQDNNTEGFFVAKFRRRK